jgi:ankyrin repeat protein
MLGGTGFSRCTGVPQDRAQAKACATPEDTLMSSKLLITALFTALLTAAPPDTRLPDAAMRGDKDAVRSLLKQKVDLNAAHGDGATALHWAAYNDDLETVKLLLAAGANVKAATREGAITPLFMACVNGDAPMVDALLKAGADANSAKSNGATALMTAASSGNVDAVKMLLDRGANVNAKEAAHGQTALMFAAALNRDAVIKLLASRGAAVNTATPVRKMERVRFDQDGNNVEERPAPKPEERETSPIAAPGKSAPTSWAA